MRRWLIISVLLTVVMSVKAQERDWLRDGLEIPDVTVTAVGANSAAAAAIKEK